MLNIEIDPFVVICAVVPGLLLRSYWKVAVGSLALAALYGAFIVRTSWPVLVRNETLIEQACTWIFVSSVAYGVKRLLLKPRSH